MPAYVNSPFQNPVLVTKGVPCYLLGSFDFKIGNTRLYITDVAIATDVATVSVQMITGPVPVVGGLISIINTTTSSGAFNVNRAVITGVTINATTGAGTITFALSSGDVSTTADSGTVIVEPAEVPETLTAEASIACLIQAPEGDSQFTVPLAVTFAGGVLPTAVTATLQVAIRNIDSEYTNTTAAVVVVSTAYTHGPVVEATLERGYFYRVLISGLTAGSATGVIAKIGG